MSIPSEFLSGFSAAAGFALINSIGNLSGFAGPYLIGVVGSRTGSLYRGFCARGDPLDRVRGAPNASAEEGPYPGVQAGILTCLDCRLPGPGTDEGHHRSGDLRCCNLGFEPLR
jgi:hypothetical protein